MGVMLSLDRQRPAGGRRRQGQHERQRDDRGRTRALTVVRRCNAPASGRLLTRLARTMLARKGAAAAEEGAARAAAAQAGPDRSRPDRPATSGSAPAA
jgi:hypothetical protein